MRKHRFVENAKARAGDNRYISKDSNGCLMAWNRLEEKKALVPPLL